MIRHCCSLKFYEINSYLKHLKFHKDNSSLQVECNECGHSSKTWDAFKKHIKIEHTKNCLSYHAVTNADVFETATANVSQTLIESEYDQNASISDPQKFWLSFSLLYLILKN